METLAHYGGLFWYCILIPSVIIFLLFSGFSNLVRKIIGQRDNWTCQSCGKGFSGGWMVHAAHNPNRHHKSHPKYDDPDSGSIRCVDCHADQHRKGTTLGKNGDAYALRKLKGTDRRTRWWREENG